MYLDALVAPLDWVDCRVGQDDLEKVDVAELEVDFEDRGVLEGIERTRGY